MQLKLQIQVTDALAEWTLFPIGCVIIDARASHHVYFVSHFVTFIYLI